MTGTVLVVGASGLVGTASVESFAAAGWDVVAVSRRPPETAEGVNLRHVPVDLRDAEATEQAVRGLGDVTHVVYAAVHEMPGLIGGWRHHDQMQTNLDMLRNLLDPLTQKASVEHVTLLQGTKAYGVHRHAIRVPARERHSRDDHENFYWLQEDHLRLRAVERGFQWTILRPQLVVGPNYGVAMNLPPVIGAYAAICCELGVPFAFPGGAAYVTEAVDARLVADAALWATGAPQAWGEHFNLTNGEVFSWRDLWPALAEELGAQTGPDEPRRLAEFLPRHAAQWGAAVRRHGLRPLRLAELLGESHHYADFCFAAGAESPPPPAFVSVVKIMQAGFVQTYDTEQSFRYWLRTLVERRVLPGH
jgi:nucleoside-diphosphate-sugar epimerase